MCTILMVSLLARQWYGTGAANWAAALLAFNEYYLAVSARATAHVPHLFLVAAALFAFGRFLHAERATSLYVAGACLGLAFYCKEHSALVLPLALLVFLHPGHRQWLRSPHLYLSVATFALLITPDLFANLNGRSDSRVVTYGDQAARQATYGDHLKRIGGIGFSPYPSMFYGRSAVTGFHVAITDTELKDETPEYPAMNPGLGALLVGAVLITTFRPGPESIRRVLLLVFWGVFGFFSLIQKGDPPGRLDPVSWIWVEATIIPAVVLAGARLAGSPTRLRIAAWALGAGALLFALMSPTLQVFARVIAGAQNATSVVRQMVQFVAAETVVTVRSHPLRTVGIALAVGIVVGSIVGFGCGWLASSRRRRDEETHPDGHGEQVISGSREGPADRTG
jgi:4-amino-4-deoxy-L-arabinose transferase-like glycosyltransferase